MQPSSSFISISKQAFQGWSKDKATVWCAALAYFTVFSLGPLLLLLISIVGFFFTKTTIEKDIYNQLRALLGLDGAKMLETVIRHAKKPSSGIIGTIVGTITLILGAIGVFGQLQQMLNHIWGVEQKPRSGIMALVRSRLLNFSMVGAIAFLLLVSLAASTAVSGIGIFLGHYLPFSPIILESINFIISFAIITILFAFILKVLPDVKVSWNNTWIGALVTSLLFTIGKTVIGIYIGHSGISSEYGAAASLIILLLWVYYSSQILFMGAEFTKMYTLANEREITPSQFSVLKRKEAPSRAQKKNDLEKAASGFTEGFVRELSKKNRKKR